MKWSVTLPMAAHFARPNDLPPVGRLAGRVAVLDLAFDGRDPRGSLRWADSLGEQLAVWIDHHEQDLWAEVAKDPRYVLVPRSVAPACPPLVTPERVEEFGPIDTIVAHGDLDGVLSAAKWMVLAQGLEAPPWIDPDGIAADTRVGELTPRGRRLDHALRADGRRNRVRRAVIASVLCEAKGKEEPPGLATILDRASDRHARIAEASVSLARRAEPVVDLAEDAVLVDLLSLPGGSQIDLTELMLYLQARHDFVIVFARKTGGGRKIVVSTNPTRSGLDLRQEFDVQGFAPFRVHVTEEQLLERLASAMLAREMR